MKNYYEIHRTNIFGVSNIRPTDRSVKGGKNVRFRMRLNRCTTRRAPFGKIPFESVSSISKAWAKQESIRMAFSKSSFKKSHGRDSIRHLIFLKWEFLASQLKWHRSGVVQGDGERHVVSVTHFESNGKLFAFIQFYWKDLGQSRVRTNRFGYRNGPLLLTSFVDSKEYQLFLFWWPDVSRSRFVQQSEFHQSNGSNDPVGLTSLRHPF